MSKFSEEVLRLVSLRKSYNIGKINEIEVLHEIDFAIKRSDFTALIGPSGSGKSTLLNILGLLDRPTSGELYLLGHPTSRMDDNSLTELRGTSIGFIFQFHHLIQSFNVLDNIMMPSMMAYGRPSSLMIEHANQLLKEVGLEGFGSRKASQLSGGQQQRVAIARALMTKPALILADEPTGNLDTHTAMEIFDLFRKVHNQTGSAVLLVTHDPRLSAKCDRTIKLVDGLIESDVQNVK